MKIGPGPSDLDIRFLLGRTLERQSEPSGALTHYRPAVAMGGRAE